MHPDVLLTQLKAAATARKARGLDLVHAVCQEEFARGNQDFTLEAIAPHIRARGGPQAASLRHPTGAHYRQLLQAWAEQARNRSYPDTLLAQLTAQADPRRRERLAAVHSACRELVDGGCRTLRMADVARLTCVRGGPAASTIRNTTGGDYRALIKAWAAQARGLPPPEQPARSQDPDAREAAVLKLMPYPSAQAPLAEVFAENRQLRAQLSAVQPPAAPDPAPAGALPTGIALTAGEIKALRQATSDRQLRARGWSQDPSGRIRNGKGRVLYKPGYLSALHKVLRAAELAE